MTDVSININGRDNLTPVLKKARAEAIGLGQDVSKIDSLNSKTKTEQRLTVEEFNRSLAEAKKKEIESKYSSQKDTVGMEFEKRRNEINANAALSKYQKTNQINAAGSKADAQTKTLDEKEQEELLSVDKDQLLVLREIKRELSDSERVHRERASRGQKEDSEKAQGGYYGSLLSNRKDLHKLKMGASTAAEAKAIQKQIEDNEGKINDVDGKRGGGSGGGFGAAGIGRSLLGGAGIGAVAATVAVAAAGYILKEGFNLDSEIYKLNALRVAGGGGKEGANYIRMNNINGSMLGMKTGYGPDISSLGMDNGAFLQSQVALAKGSGRGTDLARRAFENATVEKGMGVDNVAQFATMERQLKVQTETSQGIIELANILSNIKDSGIKKDDLTLLTEKIGIQQKLFSQQFQKRDTIDNESTNRLIAAFSTVGLNGKGARGGDFLSSLIGDAAGSGTGSNVDLIKNQAAREAFGGMNIRDLRRKVKQGDDPKYLMQLLSNVGKMTSEGSNHRESLYEALFPNLNASDYDTLDKAIKSGDFKNILAGKGNFNKTGAFSKASVEADASYNTGAYDKAAAGASNAVGLAGSSAIEMISNGLDAIKDLFTSGDAKVTVQNNSPKTPTIVKNTIKKSN